jgi:16S rRNA (cytosine1407-C5)-methyltransferase
MKTAVYNLPQEFLHKLKKIYPSDYERVYKTFLVKRSPALRINYLKTDLPNLKKEFIQENVRVQECVYPPGSFILKTPLRQFQDTDIYQKGLVHVQNISSMLPSLILDPQNQDKILDLCAAPGAKTTQIVSLAPSAEVIAVEKVRKRYYKLLSNLKTQGAASVKVMLIDGMWVRKKFPAYFDKILVDAPCSAEGRFSLQNKHSFSYWKPRKVKEMVSTQKKLMHAAFYALAEGGVMVYSTCTFSPEENEGVIDWFLDKFKDKVEVMPIKIPLDNVCKGFIHWRGKQFSRDCKLAKRIMPNELMEGFFIAKLKKISE